MCIYVVRVMHPSMLQLSGRRSITDKALRSYLTTKALHGPKFICTTRPGLNRLSSPLRSPFRLGPARSLFCPARCSLSDRGPARSHFH